MYMRWYTQPAQTAQICYPLDPEDCLRVLERRSLDAYRIRLCGYTRIVSAGQISPREDILAYLLDGETAISLHRELDCWLFWLSCELRAAETGHLQTWRHVIGSNFLIELLNSAVRRCARTEDPVVNNGQAFRRPAVLPGRNWEWE
jgi:hypothetical protein